MTRAEGGQTIYYNYAFGPFSVMVAEQDEATGQFLRFYVWTPGGRLLYMIDAQEGNKVYFYHFDRVGSTLALTDETGALTDAYAYTPFGVLLAHQGNSQQPFTFAGRWGVQQEGESGTLYQMRAQYYDAVTGQFLSREPLWPLIGVARDTNPYHYVFANPLSVVDPTGLGPLLDDL